MPERAPRKDSVLRANLGGALELAARQYPTTFRTIKEGIQNALDALAQSITIDLNLKSKIIEIKDNGSGVEVERMDRALGSICRSIKDRGALGRFGLGLMAPLDKCNRWTFTSVPPGRKDGYHEWVFNPEDIRQADSELHIPPQPRDYKQVDHPTDAREDWGWVTWRSRLRIEGFKKDRQANLLNLIDLETGILDDFNEKMRKLRTMISIRITTEDGQKLAPKLVMARDFSGKLIDESTLTGIDCRKIVFRIYLSPPSARGRQGRVVVGIMGDDFRVGFTRFATTTQALTKDPHTYLDPDTVAGLNSGIFEGEILGSDLDLMPERTGFTEDAALADYCLALNRWYAEKGAAYVEEAREDKEDHRVQRLGLKSLNVVEQFMKQVPSLEELLDSFKRGHIGRGHAKPAAGKVLGETAGPELTLVSGTVQVPTKPSGESGGQPSQERPTHHPFTVAGPEGRIRTRVSRGSTGLKFCFGVYYGSKDVARLNTVNGELTFNMAHPFWEDCKKDDRVLMHYMEFIAIQVLLLYTFPTDQREIVKEGMDALLKAYVFQLLNADRLAGRRAK